MTFDVIALGETMLALAPPAGESLQTAAALLVDHAGAESNTCVGLARLGLRTAWVSRLGADAAGDRILETLSREGIDTRWVGRDPRRPTGLYWATLTPAKIAAIPVLAARAAAVRPS